jgi:hypothetical protein
MHRDRTSRYDASRYAASDLKDATLRFGNTPVPNWEGPKLDSAGFAKITFALQSEFGNLLRFEKAYDQIKAIGFPLGDLILQPIASSRPSSDGYPPAGGHLNPIQSGHYATSVLRSVLFWQGLSHLVDIPLLAGAAICKIDPRLAEAQCTVRPSPDEIGIVIVLTVVLPKTNRAKLELTAPPQGLVPTTGATMGRYQPKRFCDILESKRGKHFAASVPINRTVDLRRGDTKDDIRNKLL